MPFDAREPIAAPDDRRAIFDPGPGQVGVWLVAVAGMLLAMILLGGLTRLTGSGLSIMEWAPVSGVLPPLSQSEWRRLFDLYRTIPQYRLLYPDLDLAGFQGLFWLEWVHRLWGRLVGLAFVLPFVWFWRRGLVSRPLGRKLLLLLLLGGMQGAVGWIMVASGFEPNATAVSPYRLVAHLAVGVALFGAVLWTGLGVLQPRAAAEPGARAARVFAVATTVLLALTIVAGGFVAGLHAGLVYNTFPLMDGALFPGDYAALSPPLRNLFENLATVQFDHRLLATITAAAAIATVVVVLRSRVSGTAKRAALALGAAIAAQYALGVTTLLAGVPAPLAAAHQCVALLALGAVLMLLHWLHAVRQRNAPRW